MKKALIYTILIGGLVAGCKPDRDDEFQLPEAPASPEFSIEMVNGDSNRFVVKDLTPDAFQRLWDIPGGTPAQSSKAIDTILFSNKGTYNVTLFASKDNGSGSPSATKTVTVVKDAPVSCNTKYALLTNDCSPAGKCWTMSREAGALKVGPSYDDFSWFTATENGLQNEQYDDGFCFTFDGLVFENRANGAAVNPWNGYQAEAYNPPPGTFVYLVGTGPLGRDQLILPDDQFMGVWDCDNLLDIVKLTETELIVRGRQRAQNGTPLAQGWFELKFIPQ